MLKLLSLQILIFFGISLFLITSVYAAFESVPPIGPSGCVTYAQAKAQGITGTDAQLKSMGFCSGGSNTTKDSSNGVNEQITQENLQKNYKNFGIINADEDPFLEKILIDKELSCNYDVNKFDEKWVTSMFEDIESCKGELKEIIGQLLIIS